MASRLSVSQLLTLISHTAPPKFELVHGRDLTLFIFKDGKAEGIATCEVESLADIRDGVQLLGYDPTDEWRSKGEVGYVFEKK